MTVRSTFSSGSFSTIIHTFFFQDDNPSQETLQRFTYLSPSAQAMPKFEVLLQKQYGVYRELKIARLLELPDIYQPQLGERPRANLCLCHEPINDRIVTGMSGTPQLRSQEIYGT